MKYNRNSNLQKNLNSPKGTTEELLNEISNKRRQGLLHILYIQYLKPFGLSTNIVIPYKDKVNSKICDLVIINNPDDVERITEKHTKKTPYLKPFVYDSIISTTNVEHWRKQRRSYQPAFSVSDKLKPIIPVSNNLAKLSIEKLINYNHQCDEEYFDIYEFFLNETMLQLQIAMFGFSEKFEKETNSKIRKAFNKYDLIYGRKFIHSLLEELELSDGPLSQAMKDRNRESDSKAEIFGNALIFPFAGHDTTANTLTWLIYELGKNNNTMIKLQKEVDNFWLDIKDQNNITFEDFKKLPYMTRCIMEILRLWTAIPNGTSRELVEDDYIVGKGGESVKIPKGTYVQIPNWTRHRNPELWGEDVNIFNPDREFIDEELWNNSGINTYNPNTLRFSPFTYGPRDCIGKNFSQIEMRLILLHLIKNFTFTIPNSQLNKYDQDTISYNSVTLGPRNMFNKNLYDNKLGLYVNLIPRLKKSKL